METLLIEIKNKKARKLLEDLEDLNLINLVEQNGKEKVDLSKFFNVLTPKEGKKRLKELEKDRAEWAKRNF